MIGFVDDDAFFLHAIAEKLQITEAEACLQQQFGMRMMAVYFSSGKNDSKSMKIGMKDTCIYLPCSKHAMDKSISVRQGCQVNAAHHVCQVSEV